VYLYTQGAASPHCSGGAPKLIVGAADANGVGYQRRSPAVAIGSTVTTIRVELTRDATAQGRVRYWIDHPYSDPPTGELASLEQTNWGAIDSVALGLGDSSAMFRVAYAGLPVLFDQFETDDNFIFWDGFQ